MESAQIITDGQDPEYGAVVDIVTPTQNPSILIVCEHASHHIPAHLDNLGLTQAARLSHAAWDPGALAVAQAMVAQMPALLIHSCVSRLVYDCNRPPEAQSAIPEKSEIYDIPGNTQLSPAQRQERIERVYRPFEAALRAQIDMHRATLTHMVTIHSFTPVFHGQRRDVEIGILHGSDVRFAHAMMATRPSNVEFDVRLNEPYSAQDGVAHTLDLHGAGNALANVMIEIRNDLIETPDRQEHTARYLCAWLRQAIAHQRGGAS